MKWVLDTNIISYLLRGDTAVRAAFESAWDEPGSLFVLSPVVDYEIRRYGLDHNSDQFPGSAGLWPACGRDARAPRTCTGRNHDRGRRYLLLKGANRNLAQYEALTATWTAAPLAQADWRQAASLWADRHRNGTPIEDADRLIAVTAMAQGAVLVTHNSRHFSRLGLQLIDWCQP